MLEPLKGLLAEEGDVDRLGDDNRILPIPSERHTRDHVVLVALREAVI